MSKADKIFVEMCTDILEHGTDTRGEIVRPKWPDGTPAYTIKKFGQIARYDLRDEFPAVTHRKTGIKSATQELLWIYQKKSNNIKDLGLSIWDEWADKNGSIGKAYGYQVRLQSYHHSTKAGSESHFDILDRLHNEGYDNPIIMPNDNGFTPIYMDQMDAVLYDLRHRPFSRRIITNLWNVQDLKDMNLQPCAYSCTFNVTDEGADKLVLNMILNQRSQDILAANSWNVCQYAVFLMMVAQSVNMIPGQFIHVIADAHIYDRHVDIIKDLITREQYPAPTVTLDPDIKDFYKFTKDSIKVENYQAGEPVKDIPIAI